MKTEYAENINYWNRPTGLSKSDKILPRFNHMILSIRMKYTFLASALHSDDVSFWIAHRHPLVTKSARTCYRNHNICPSLNIILVFQKIISLDKITNILRINYKIFKAKGPMVLTLMLKDKFWLWNYENN